jgi:membrane-bound ClpP family serine protease
MKKLLVLMLFMISTSLGLAQRGERVASIKVAFIANKLNLDPKTAERFWPVYNQYDEELHNLIEEKRRAKKDDASVEDMIDTEQKVVDLRKKYTAQFSKIISNDQIATLFRAEKEFRQMLLRRAGRDK